MKSIAIAYRSSNGVMNNNSVPIELHLNLWKVAQKKYYLDFGIMCDFKYDAIKILIPCKLATFKNTVGRDSKWCDFGGVIGGDETLLRALFNENYSSYKPNTSEFYQISGGGEEKTSMSSLFYIYKLTSEELKISQNQDNDDISEIDITVRNSGNLEGRYYLRFRVMITDISKIGQPKDLSNAMLQSAFSKMEFYDLRINEPRVLDDECMRRIKNGRYQLCKFSKVKIFYIADYKVSVESGSQVKSDSRLIEPKIWGNYEPVEMKEELCLAHHWKFLPGASKEYVKKESVLRSIRRLFKNEETINECEGIGEVSLFFTATYPKFQWVTVTAYVSMLVLFGALGSFLVNWESGSDENLSIFSPSTWNFKIYMLAGMFAYVMIFLLTRLKQWFRRVFPYRLRDIRKVN